MIKLKKILWNRGGGNKEEKEQQIHDSKRIWEMNKFTVHVRITLSKIKTSAERKLHKEKELHRISTDSMRMYVVSNISFWPQELCY